MEGFLKQHGTEELVETWNSDEISVAFEAALEEMKEALTTQLKPAKAKTTRAKKLKDPKAPKAAKSSYMWYFIENQGEYRAAHPDLKSPEISKALGAQWKSLTEEEKEPYVKKAAEDKARFQAESADYTPSPGFQAKLEAAASAPAGTKSGSAKKKTKRDPNAPKTPRSGYLFFCNEKRASVKEANPDMTPNEVMKQLGVLWKELKSEGGEDLAKYTAMATEDKARYEKEKAEWSSGASDSGKEESEGETEAPKAPPKKSKPPSKKKATKPPTKPQAAETAVPPPKKVPKKPKGYEEFTKAAEPDIKKDNPKITKGDMAKMVAKMWKELDAADRKGWKEYAESTE